MFVRVRRVREWDSFIVTRPAYAKNVAFEGLRFAVWTTTHELVHRSQTNGSAVVYQHLLDMRSHAMGKPAMLHGVAGSKATRRRVPGSAGVLRLCDFEETGARKGTLLKRGQLFYVSAGSAQRAKSWQHCKR